MTEADLEYYRGQKVRDLRYICTSEEDPAWKTEVRKRKNLEKQKIRQQSSFRNNSNIEVGDNEVSDEPELDDGEKDEPYMCQDEEVPSAAKKIKQFDHTETPDQHLPEKYCSMRDSERLVKETVYNTLASLQGC